MENEQSTNYQILIVDDVPQNIKVAANILRDERYKLFFATSGSDALTKVQSQSFDLILLDVMMPDMDGFQVCEQLKQVLGLYDIPIIFLTAKTDTESVVKGFELGAVDYVTKPFNGAELLARVKTHLALQQAKRELQTLNATKDKFFSIIAHDLRSPFTALLGLTELIAQRIDHYTQEEILQIAEELHTSAESIHALIENLLTWSRIQRGMIEYAPGAISLNEIANHNVLLLQLRTTQKQIALVTQVHDEITAYADYYMVNTILRNLLSNAFKFTDAGGTITLSIRQKHHLVEIVVTDTGIGIPEGDLPKLFRIDVRYSRSGTSGEQGTGLGLILCKEMVEKNGGQIWVESEVGKGSTFTFTLPTQQPPRDT